MTNVIARMRRTAETGANDWREQMEEEVNGMMTTLLGGAVMRHAVEWREHLAELKVAIAELSGELPSQLPPSIRTDSGEIGSSKEGSSSEPGMGSHPMAGSTST